MTTEAHLFSYWLVRLSFNQAVGWRTRCLSIDGAVLRIHQSFKIPCASLLSATLGHQTFTIIMKIRTK